jgi:formylglycine-generating enzyme required for sulfatase activity
MGRGEKVWPLFEHRPHPTVRSFLIDRAGPCGVNAKVLISRLDEEKEISARRAILLSLGEYGLDRFAQEQRQNLVPRLLELYRDDLDPGIHGAAEWLLRQWEMAGPIKEIDKALATGKVEGKRQWYINRHNQTMILISRPEEFWMGEGQGRHRQQIGRSFALASKEVTVEQFLAFRKEHKYYTATSRTIDCPVNSVTWYEAAGYCNWLSEQERIPKDQWCYEPNKDGQYAAGMRMAANYLQRTGYRLPTEAEWEYACRAHAETSFAFGQAEELVGKYGWYYGNSPSRSQPVGKRRPNDLGLFDMHGNAMEWCQDGSHGEDDRGTWEFEPRVLRGGSFVDLAVDVRSANRSRYVPTTRLIRFGFRPARTFRP